MEAFERKHMVGVNRGKFFAAPPPDCDDTRNAVVAGRVMHTKMQNEMRVLKQNLLDEYAAKKEEYAGPPKVEGFTGVSGDTTPLHSAAQYGE